MSNFDQQKEKFSTQDGFVAALDQSGGSTPKALKLYGISEDAWSGDDEMFDLVHQMRTRIITSPAFNGDRILAAILFENTMDRDIEGQPRIRPGSKIFLSADRNCSRRTSRCSGVNVRCVSYVLVPESPPGCGARLVTGSSRRRSRRPSAARRLPP